MILGSLLLYSVKIATVTLGMPICRISILGISILDILLRGTRYTCTLGGSCILALWMVGNVVHGTWIPGPWILGPNNVSLIYVLAADRRPQTNRFWIS